MTTVQLIYQYKSNRLPDMDNTRSNHSDKCNQLMVFQSLAQKMSSRLDFLTVLKYFREMSSVLFSSSRRVHLRNRNLDYADLFRLHQMIVFVVPMPRYVLQDGH